MRHEIPYRPTFAQLEVTLDQGEAVRAEAGAMLAHSRGIDVETDASGGFLQSLKRSVFGGESFFLNRFVAREPGSVTFAPRLPGDVISRDLGTEPLFVQSSSFLAGTPEVDLDTKFGGFRTFFAGEGLFLLRLTGPGLAFLSSFGAIDEIQLRAGEEYVVDTGHVVAFESSIPYSVRRVGGLTSTVFSGEGLVVEFEGPGTIWTQSRSPDAFLSWIAANAPSRGGAVVPLDYSSDTASGAGTGGTVAGGRGGGFGGMNAGGGFGGGKAGSGFSKADGGESISGGAARRTAGRPRPKYGSGGRAGGNSGRRGGGGSKGTKSPDGGRGGSRGGSGMRRKSGRGGASSESKGSGRGARGSGSGSQGSSGRSGASSSGARGSGGKGGKGGKGR